MSWYSSDYPYRALVRVPAGAGSDTTLTLPANWDAFWTTVQSTGYDVRFTDKTGDTLLTYERATWLYASKSAVFEVQGGNQETGLDSFIFMYWGYATATDVSAAVAPAGPTAAVDLMAPASLIVDVVPDAPGATAPATEFTKIAAEAPFLTFRVDPGDLLQRRDPSAGRLRLEELASAAVAVYDADGTTTSVTLTATVDFAYENASGAQFVVVSLASGTSGSDYVLELTASGTHYVRYKRITVKVRNLSAT